MNEQTTSVTSATPANVSGKWFHNSERDRWLIVTGVLLLLGGLWLGYFIGHKQGMSVVGASESDLEKLKDQVTDQDSSIATLTRTLSATVQERDIALSTSKGLNDKLTQQAADDAQVNLQLQAYRDRLLASGGFPLTLQSIDVTPISQNVFEYHVDLMQLRQRTAPLRGTLRIHLIQGGTTVDVPVSESVNLSDYQRLTGRWTMPAGFTPEYMEVSADAGGQSLTQRYAWERGAPIKNAPLTATPDARTAKVSAHAPKAASEPVTSAS